MQTGESQVTAVTIPAGAINLEGQLEMPAPAHGLVLFAHGTGSSRHSARNQRVAADLHAIGLGTLLFDLLSPDEEPDGTFNARLRFDVGLLASRLRQATQWARQQPETAELMIGYFGASTGAAAALVAAANDMAGIGAVVTRGGRVELAHAVLPRVQTPTMLIVGGNDEAVAAGNLEAWAQLRCAKAIEIIPGAGHLFEEPGALENVAALAARWFGEHLHFTRS